MINNQTEIYKNFNIQQIKHTPYTAATKKDAAIEKKQDDKKPKTNNMTLLIPPLTGFGIGTISSILYSSDKNKGLSRKIENYKEGLELGFNTRPLTGKINDNIKKSRGQISEMQAENLRIQKAGHILDSVDARNAEIIELNNSAIKSQTDYITQLKENLDELHKYIVEKPLKEYTAKNTAIAKSQIKQFKIGIITGLTVIGMAVSCIIHRIKNKND